MWTGDWKVKDHTIECQCVSHPSTTVLDCLQVALWNLMWMDSQKRPPEMPVSCLLLTQQELSMSFTPLRGMEKVPGRLNGEVFFAIYTVFFEELSSCKPWCLPNGCLGSQGGSGLSETELYQPFTEFCVWNQKPFPGTGRIVRQVHIASCNTWMDGWMNSWIEHTHIFVMQILEKKLRS